MPSIVNHLQNIKRVQIIQPQVITDNDDPVGAYGDANPVSVDTKGFSFAKITVAVGATDIAMTALAVYSGAAAASGADDATYSALSGAAFTGGDLPQADDDNKLFTFFIDLRDNAVGRFLALDATCGNGDAGTYIVADCELYGSVDALTSASNRGHADEVIV